MMRSLISGYRRNTGEASRSAWSRVSVPAAYYRAARTGLDLGTLSEMVDCAFDPGSGFVLNSVQTAPLEPVLLVNLVTPG